MNKKNILIITGTRADYGILKPFIKELKKETNFNTKILVTGMHTLSKYGNTNKIIENDFKIDSLIKISENGNVINWLNEEIAGIYDYLKTNVIDLIFVLGDRGEAFAGAIAAMHLNIALAHIHGGDTTGHMPDEYIRNCITKTSIFHFVATEEHYKKVFLMGENPKYIFNVGALCMSEIIDSPNFTLNEVEKEIGFNINNGFILFLLHPSSYDNINGISYENQIEAGLKILENYSGEKIIIYPNSDEGTDIFIKKIEEYKSYKGYHLIKNLDRKIYLSLLKYCDIFIGNSSSGIIETEGFGTITINIGNRQKGRIHGNNVIDTEYNLDKNIQLLNYCLKNKDYLHNKFNKEEKKYYKKNTIKEIIKVIKETDFKILNKDKFNF